MCLELQIHMIELPLLLIPELVIGFVQKLVLIIMIV